MHTPSIVHGFYTVTCRDADGNIKWREGVPNGVVNVGLNYLLDAGLANGTQITTWYLGLIDGTSTPTLAASDTIASHAGWTENTAYSESTRETWTAGTVASQSVNNSASVATFTFTSSEDIDGAFLVSNSTKGGTTGTLYSTGLFSAGRSVTSGDTIDVTYTASLTAS